ncbi:MAG: hypothetical protein ABI867_27210 [Kofleriaceae bacterium]
MRAIAIVMVLAGVVVADPRPKLAVKKALPGVDVVESVNQASHVHGGSPVSITEASVNLVVKDGKAHTVVVSKLELLRGNCNETTWSSRDVLKPLGYEIHDWDTVDPVAKGTTKITLPAKSDLYSMSVRFAPVSAYQACDRFAFSVRMLVDGKPVALEAPLQIKRYEPLRMP